MVLAAPRAVDIGRTNDAKNNMSYAEFVALCQRVVAHRQPLL